MIAVVLAAAVASQVGSPATSTTSSTPPMLSLKQLTVTWQADVDPATRRAKVEEFVKATRTITDCTSADVVAAQQHAATVQNDAVPASAFPEQLQKVIASTPVGRATPVFGNITQGARVMVVCARR